jgi:hypothetical protein
VAPPSGSRAIPDGLAPGDVLAARYRLVRPVPGELPGPRPSTVWLASDEVLARPVAAKVLLAAGPGPAATTGPFLDAAATAGSVSSPVLVRTYDAAVEQRSDSDAPAPVDVAYVISEWVDGTTLTDLLRQDGPLGPAEAVALTTTLAEALSTAHAAGLVHGRVHPGNVLVARNGAVRLTDLAVSAALPDGRVPTGRADDPEPPGADVRDLAAVLYALLTARWPVSATPQPAAGVPAAPALREGDEKRGRLISPRQVRAGVPRALDEVVMRALDPRAARQAPALTTPAGLSDALETAVGTDPSVRPRRVRRRPLLPAPVRRALPTLAVVAGLTAIGVVAYSAGREVGTVETPPDQAAALTSPTPSPGAVTTTAPIDLTGVPVRDFDPEGDGGERPGSVANAHDGDPTTTWETERYDTAAFGGLKQGVGLLVDLGAPTGVTQVELVLARPGVSVQVRAAPAEAADAGSYPVLAEATAGSDRVTLDLPAGTDDRFYLVWFTDLVPDDGGFSAEVAELVFTGTSPPA